MPLAVSPTELHHGRLSDERVPAHGTTVTLTLTLPAERLRFAAEADPSMVFQTVV
ncbi:MAG TPA: hypothetical protein VJN67_19300 [Stellaceae bacterium]|nr:hypothetical protein [Stellaceae bacterium]